MRQFSMTYIFLFALGLCLACSAVISVAAVSLRDEQDVNRKLDKRKSVLLAARLVEPGEKVDAARIDELFQQIEPLYVDIETYEVVNLEEEGYQPDEIPNVAPEQNLAQVSEVPRFVEVFEVQDENGETDMLVLPIYGKGLWSTLYGFLALGDDMNTIEGLTYYQHGETPGLGGEVDNPRWKALWPGRKAYNEEGEVAIHLVKGAAGPVESNPYEVDGLSGATITARGVTNMLQFWLGEQGLGPFLKNYKESA